MKVLDCRDVKISYPTITPIQSATLCVQKGEIVALIGPSGCGKTSLIRAIAGFEPIAAGEIYLNQTLVSSPTVMVPPQKRQIGFVFQAPTLFAHLSVKKNILFGLAHLPKSQQKETLSEMLAFIDIPEKEDAYPHELSGGQQQRVALARALAPQPQLLLLDEPFANLDPEKRNILCQRLKHYLNQANMTAIFISHHPEDAQGMADRCLTIKAGIVYPCD